VQHCLVGSEMCIRDRNSLGNPKNLSYLSVIGINYLNT
jgi:hypothetical protein